MQEGHGLLSEGNGSGAKKRKKRARRVRRRKSRQSRDETQRKPQQEVVMEIEMEGSVETAEMVGASATMIQKCGTETTNKLTIDSLPDEALSLVVEMLGTPGGSRYDSSGHRLKWDLTSMAQVCHRWNKAVRSSGVWKMICESHWPWMQSDREHKIQLVSDDPRLRFFKKADKERDHWWSFRLLINHQSGWKFAPISVDVPGMREH